MADLIGDSKPTLSGPTPPRPQSTPRPSPRPDPAVNARLIELKQQLKQQMISRQAWINDRKSVNKLQRSLANDPLIRQAAFQLYRQDPRAFQALNPKDQLKLIQRVSATLKVTAYQLLSRAHQEIDPNDVTHPFNQANPLNLANQNLAIQSGVVTAENIEVDEENTHENLILLSEEQAENIEADNLSTLSEIDLYHIGEARTPRPTPGNKSDDEDEEDKHASEKHHHLKHDVVEERVLHHYLSHDRSALVQSMMGHEKAPLLEKGLSAALTPAE